MRDQNSTAKPAPRRLSDLAVLGILLMVGLANGLIYIFLLPPWQHYDEPGHFEVVWLAAHRNHIPRADDYDPEMSRAVVVSMVQNHFYGDATVGFPAESEQVIVPGYRQLDEPPGYYILASLPVRLLRLLGVDDVTAQLRAARSASLLLFLLTIVCAWGITRELTRSGHFLRWMVPLSLALMPGLVDLMTAVNDDVAAVAVFSLFLWGAIRLIRRPFSLLNLLWTLAAIILAYFTKVTVLIALILLPVALLFSIFRGRLRWISWAALSAGVLTMVLAAFSWGDAAWWARNTFQAVNTRQANPQAPVGDYVFQLQLPAGASAAQDYQLHQLIALPAGESLKGKDVTVGAWMWASRPLKASAPIFNTAPALASASKVVELNETPQFVIYSTPVQGEARRNFISLSPWVEAVDTPATVYYDGVVVLPGTWPLDKAPVFKDASGQNGAWGGQAFRNLLRNSSAETPWMRLRSWVDAYGVRILPDKGSNQPSVSLYYLLDTAAAWPFQRLSARILFRTFWASFAWGHVALLQDWSYSIILAAVIFGSGGALIAMWRLRKTFPWREAAFLGLALLGVWLQTFLRGANYPTQLRAIYYPTARYAYPVIIPGMLLLNLGWYELGRAFKIGLRLPVKALSAVYVLGWVFFDLYAILSISSFYYHILG